MSCKIKLTKRAEKDLKGLDPQTRKRIEKGLEELARGRANYLPLVGPLKGLYRMRVGKYRIAFSKPSSDFCLVHYIRHRSKAY